MTQPSSPDVPLPLDDDRDVLTELAELAALGDDRPAWQDLALCAQTDPEAFFPEKGGSTRESKEICQHCEVRTDCLEYALRHDQRYGIWGGLSERERRHLKRSSATTETAPTSSPPTSSVTGEAPRAQRESAPAPGAGRHVGAAGTVTTLPTEPRYARGRPHQAPRSTFPARARIAASTEPNEPDAPAPAGRSAPAARTRQHASPARVPAPRSAPEQAPPRTATTRPDRAAAIAAEPRGPAAGRAERQIGERCGVAAAAPTASRAPHRAAEAPVLAAVLSAQADQPGASAADPAIVEALATGETVAAASPWEVALAGVTGIQRGQTRGQMARRLGEDCRDIAHQYRRWLEDMPLIEPHRDGTPDGTDRQPRPDPMGPGGAR